MHWTNKSTGYIVQLRYIQFYIFSKKMNKKIIILLEQQYMITARDQGVGRLAPIRVRKLDENAVGLHVRKVDEKRGRSTRSHYAYSG